MSDQVQYPDDFVERLQTIWGEGFLSPGGPREVREIVRGLDLAGARVLDIGCGAGGPAIVLAGQLGAAEVVAVDVEAQLLTRAAASARRAGCAERITFQLVEPGPLPFADGAFDLVFSKDALIHVADKGALYAEVLRVLRPGGGFAASDWLGDDHTAASPEWARYRELGHLEVTMATAAETEAVMIAAGLAQVDTRDRNAWYAALARQEVEQIAGPLRDHLVEAVGPRTYAQWLEVKRALADAVAVGALRPTHLRGIAPQG